MRQAFSHSWFLGFSRLLLVLAIVGFSPSSAWGAGSPGERLVHELGCVHCHDGLPVVPQGHSIPLREKTPDLSSAGLRYQPGYLFEFLQNPVKVRRHLGSARMPAFHLTTAETLALVAFLETQTNVGKNWPALPESVQRGSIPPTKTLTGPQFRQLITKDLICATCHLMDGQGGFTGLELSHIGYRLNPSWVKAYLVSPEMFGVPPATMPAQFFRLNDTGNDFVELRADASEKIHTVTQHLFALQSDRRASQESRLQKARQELPEHGAAMGEQIFRALNCAGCHRHATILPQLQGVAPDLSREGRRVRKDWLTQYLQSPHPIRPFGYHPGKGGRMPDFGLNEEETTDLAQFIMGLNRNANVPKTIQAPSFPKVSAFAMNKAALMLEKKLSCLGCHRLNGQGGRIGPDLGMAGARLQPQFIYDVINDPGMVLGHDTMPALRLSDDMVKLLAGYLGQGTFKKEGLPYLSLADHPGLGNSELPGTDPVAAQLYQRHCSACHGVTGGGDGFNSSYLSIKPTRHSDGDYMSTRSDDVLYDGVAAGGYILNKSHQMPPWGGSLSPAEIRQMVAYMRTLCQCKGPDWSLDPKQP